MLLAVSTRARLLSLAWLGLVGCGGARDSDAVPDSAADSAASAIGSSSANSEPPSVPSPNSEPATQPTLPPEPAADLAAILPPAGEPITLKRARELAGSGEWLEAAAVYDAMFRADAADIRALAGRGHALASAIGPNPEARVLLACADYELALTQLADTDPLAAAVHYNFGLLEEGQSKLDAAKLHYQRAVEIKPSKAARAALLRVGGTLPPTLGACTQSEPELAIAAATLVDVVAVITKTLVEAGTGTEPAPVSEDVAREWLCDVQPCSTNAPFITRYNANSSDSIEAHFVVPQPNGFWVVPKVAFGNGIAARCPDDLPVTTAESRDGFALAHVALLTNYWDDCDMEDPDCLNGCWWESRAERAIVLSPASGRYVVIEQSTEESPMAERVLLPADLIRIADGKASVAGCGLAGVLGLD